MDPVSLDSAVTTFLIPHLTKMGEKVPKDSCVMGITNTGGTVATNESMALELGGDLKGNLVIGDGNTISQTGDKPSARHAGRKTRKGR
jgi:hypothetical protein